MPDQTPETRATCSTCGGSLPGYEDEERVPCNCDPAPPDQEAAVERLHALRNDIEERGIEPEPHDAEGNTDANCEGKGHNGGHTWRSAVVCAECGADERQLWHASELLLAFAEYLWKSGYTRGQSTLEATSGNPDPYTPEYFVQQFKRTKAWQLRSDYERGVEDEQRRQEAPASDQEAAVERVRRLAAPSPDHGRTLKPDARAARRTVLAALDTTGAEYGAQEMAVWATVLVDKETFTPREATEGDLEKLADLDLAVERCWIQPGPVLAPLNGIDVFDRWEAAQEAAQPCNAVGPGGVLCDRPAGHDHEHEAGAYNWIGDLPDQREAFQTGWSHGWNAALAQLETALMSGVDPIEFLKTADREPTTKEDTT